MFAYLKSPTFLNYTTIILKYGGEVNLFYRFFWINLSFITPSISVYCVLKYCFAGKVGGIQSIIMVLLYMNLNHTVLPFVNLRGFHANTLYQFEYLGWVGSWAP